MKNCRQLLIPTLCILLASLFLAVLPTDAEAEIYNDTVRLHILAASDSEEDQTVKLAVRDALLNEFGDRLSAAKDPAEAKRLAQELLPEIRACANRVLEENGFSYGAEVTLTEEDYPTRYYEDFSMPAGRYLSLRVLLGGGNGHNWWCVVFPPLCTSLACEKAEEYYSFSERELIERGDVTVRFKLLEMLSSLDGKKP